MAIQPKDASQGSADDVSPDDKVIQLCHAFAERMPPILSSETELNTMDSMEVCCHQEKDRFNKLIQVMNNSLKEIEKAIKGVILMTPKLDQMYQSFLNNMVPQLWTASAYPSLKPLGSWFDDFLKRTSFFQNWLDNGKPKAYWLSCFFFPQGFLTSQLQNYSRRFAVPVDKMSYKYQMTMIYDV